MTQADREAGAAAAICQSESVRVELVAVVADLDALVLAIRARADRAHLDEPTDRAGRDDRPEAPEEKTP